MTWNGSQVMNCTRYVGCKANVKFAIGYLCTRKTERIPQGFVFGKTSPRVSLWP